MTTPAPAQSPAQIAQSALARVKLGMDSVLWEHPHWGPAFSQVRGLLTPDWTCETFAINAQGRIRFNPALAMSLPVRQLGWIIAHEVSHPMLDHFARMPERADGEIWNVAGDCVINAGILADGGPDALPAWVVTTPKPYTGPLVTEAIYSWLRRNPDQAPKGGKAPDGSPMPGAGCGAEPGPADGEAEGGASAPQAGQGTQAGAGQAPAPGKARGADWADVANRTRAVASLSKTGHGIVAAIKPSDPFLDLAKILRFGAQQATTGAGRATRTYSRMNRRGEGAGGICLPGYQGGGPKLGVVIDVSSSVDRSWVARMAAETIKLARAFPDLRIYLVAHTDRVCWEGWITSKSAGADVVAATSFDGGTDFGPAYRALEAQGTFDAVIHFTDCEIKIWPAPPTRKLIVGAFGGVMLGTPPAGATVIPCRDPDLGGEG